LTVEIQKTFDGRHAVYVDGIYRFAGDEAACHQWISTVITKPVKDREAMGARLDWAVGIMGR
jgi:hypothetical protein